MLKITEVECLKIAADIENGITIVVTKSVDLWTGAEMIVDAITFAGARVAAIVEDKRVKAVEEVRMKFGKSSGERALADAGGAGENDEATRRVCWHNGRLALRGLRGKRKSG